MQRIFFLSLQGTRKDPGPGGWQIHMYLHVHSSGSLLQSPEVLHGKLTFLASTSNLKPAFIIFVNNYNQGSLMYLKVLGENWIEVFYILKYDFFNKKIKYCLNFILLFRFKITN